MSDLIALVDALNPLGQQAGLILGVKVKEDDLEKIFEWISGLKGSLPPGFSLQKVTVVKPVRKKFKGCYIHETLNKAGAYSPSGSVNGKWHKLIISVDCTEEE